MDISTLPYLGSGYDYIKVYLLYTATTPKCRSDDNCIFASTLLYPNRQNTEVGRKLLGRACRGDAEPHQINNKKKNKNKKESNSSFIFARTHTQCVA